MTEHGQRVLDAMSDGSWYTLKELVKATASCERKTTATLKGCIVAGLVEMHIDDQGRLFRIIPEET